MKIYLYILIQLKGGPPFCFQYTFSIKYGIKCPFGPFTTFIHYDIINRFQYQNIYKTKLAFVQKMSNIFHECRVGALLQLCEALMLTLNRCSLFLRTFSLCICAIIQKNWFNLPNNKSKSAITINNILHFKGKIYVPVFARKTLGFQKICSSFLMKFSIVIMFNESLVSSHRKAELRNNEFQLNPTQQK